MNLSSRQQGRAGFNLVEVCLAIVVVAFGIVTLLGLFSSGLRTAETADNETRMTLFGGGVMNGIIAKACAITNWTTWTNDVSFASNVSTGLVPAVAPTWLPGGAQVVYPTGSTLYVRYRLDMTTRVNTRGREINLEVVPDQFGNWTNPVVFHTVVSFLGM